MLSAALLVFTLSTGAETAPAKNYSLETVGTTAEVQSGKQGTLKLHIKPADGYKVSAEAPLKIGLEAPGLGLSKKQLGHADKKDQKSTSPEFTVDFKAPTAGAQSITVDALFFVCNEKLCERKTEKVTVAVAVKP